LGRNPGVIVHTHVPLLLSTKKLAPA